MKIGNIELENNIFLAPMAGITDTAFRRICRSYGAGFVCSEMVSAKGLYYGDKKTAELMRISDCERPCAIQIFGSEPEIMAEAARRTAEYKPDAIDINMGCPVPKIAGNGDGSALMKNPELVGEIVRAVSDAAEVPVTVKIRKGWDDDSVNAVDIAKIAEANGAAAIAVHGRTRQQYYSGQADWEIIRAVKNAVFVPVIGSGDVWTAEDAKRMLEITGCDAVMIARGALGNPFIFRQAVSLFETGSAGETPSPREKLSQAITHAEALVKDKGEPRGVKEARKHIAWYIKGLPGASKIKNEIFKVEDLDTVHGILTGFMKNFM